MTQNGWAIAKAEYYTQMSRFHRRRTSFIVGLAFFGIIWALIITPWIITILLDSLTTFKSLLMVALPGVMRAVILMYWAMVLLFPISRALQEIKIGQWEIILSHNVRTRDLLMGTFMGKIPVYGLLTLFLAPILITPFAIVFQISMIGQALIYGVIFLVALSTLMLSTVICTAIQAKLGESPKGNDIAKALSVALGAVFIIPMYGLMYFSENLANILGMDVFLLFPFTWGADLITWSIINFNGLNLPTATISGFEKVLGFPALIDGFLLGIFAISVVGIGLSAADRLFNFGGGGRASVKTVGPDNFLLQILRRIIPGPFGVLVVTSIKDFSRKMQNLSQLGLGLIMALLLPIMQKTLFARNSGNEDVPFFLILMMVSLIMGIFSGMVFGGIGFLESQDQLWIIKSAPKGVHKFVKARLTESFLFSIPLVVIPVIGTFFTMNLGSGELLLLLANTYAIVCAGILVSTGITALNPNYEDTKSSAFTTNKMASMMIISFTPQGILFASLIFRATWLLDNIIYFALVNSIPLLSIGIILIFIGTRHLSKPDKT